MSLQAQGTKRGSLVTMLNITSGRSAHTWRVRCAIVRRRESSACKFPRAFKETLSERIESRRTDTLRDTQLFFSLSDTRTDFDTTHVRAPMDSQALLSRAGTCATFAIPIVHGDWCSGSKCILFSLLIWVFSEKWHCWNFAKIILTIKNKEMIHAKKILEEYRDSRYRLRI